MPSGRPVHGLSATVESVHDRVARVMGARLSADYEAHEFVLPAGVQAVSIRQVVNHLTACSCQRAGGPFSVVPRAAQVSIRNLGSARVYARLNAPDSDPVGIFPREYLYWTFVEVTDVFLTGAAQPVDLAVVFA